MNSFCRYVSFGSVSRGRFDSLQCYSAVEEIRALGVSVEGDLTDLTGRDVVKFNCTAI
jgi:hypothetical protein